MNDLTKAVSEKLIDESNLPGAVGILVSATTSTVAAMSIMETIQMSVQIMAVLCSMAVSVFTIRYLIIKTKNLKK